MPSDMTVSSKPIPNAYLLGIIAALAGAAFFATKGIIIKLAMLEGVDAVTTLTWRMIVAVPIFVLVGILGYRRKLAEQPPGAPPLLDGPTLLKVLGVGVMGYYLSSFLDFQALEYISAQLDRLILLTYPFFVVMFGWIFYRRAVTLPTGLEADKADATFENGVLRLRIPRAEQAKPRHIQIKPVTNGEVKAVEAGSTAAAGTGDTGTAEG